MKRTLLYPLLTMIAGACTSPTLEDTAEAAARAYTEKSCPTPFVSLQRTDSVTFNRATHTFTYYYLLTGVADNAAIIDTMHATLHQALLTDTRSDLSKKLYKEAGYSFHHVYRSHKTRKLLFEDTIGPKDYKNPSTTQRN